MEIESQHPQQEQPTITNHTKLLRTILLVVNFTIMFFGNCGTPLFLRFYFLHGGQRKWLSSWIQTAGWPLIFLPLLLSYFNRRRSDRRLSLPTKPYFMTLPLFAACTVLGLLTGLDDFFYAFGTSYLPVSTSAILISTQLGFTALFAFFLVKQRFTPFSVNAVALLMLGAVILGMDSRKDRPKGETRKEYLAGFCMMVAAALLYGVVLPLVELTYAKAKQAVTYTLVMEMQLVMGFFATAFCTVGMIVNKDFQAIPREAKEFGLGEIAYSLSSSSSGQWVRSILDRLCSQVYLWPPSYHLLRYYLSLSFESSSPAVRESHLLYLCGDLCPTFMESIRRARKRKLWLEVKLRPLLYKDKLRKAIMIKYFDHLLTWKYS